ncbi:hypothetical protein B296_00024195 [Ensete ventricosum]|uniref:Uncharacterized protein n=1 Tax=Ensete ventricosum TaxID=4639 RepID=A0A426YF12_ENSVE|nr:hypothetical protein B296_00024195 [Ensete ventricosum]
MGRPALPPPVDAPVELANGRLALRGNKRPSTEGGEPPRKKTKLTVLKRPTSTIRVTSERGHRYKGKELAETAKLPSHAFTLRELCEVGDRVGKDRYFAAHISKLLRAESEEQQKVWWLNFTSSTQIALECFRAKYPDSSVEEDPFVEQPEDVNVRMEPSQPFDDSTPLEE